MWLHVGSVLTSDRPKRISDKATARVIVHHENGSAIDKPRLAQIAQLAKTKVESYPSAHFGTSTTCSGSAGTPYVVRGFVCNILGQLIFA